MVQGRNSSWSPFIGGSRDSESAIGYTGPYPPDKTHWYTLKVYALDEVLELEEGFYLNELRREVKEHAIDRDELEIPSRAN